MAIDISSIIQKHITEAEVALEENTDTTDTTELNENTTGGIRVDFESAIENSVSDDAILESDSDSDSGYFLSEGEISEIRGTIFSVAVASNVEA